MSMLKLLELNKQIEKEIISEFFGGLENIEILSKFESSFVFVYLHNRYKFEYSPKSNYLCRLDKFRNKWDIILHSTDLEPFKHLKEILEQI